MATKEPVLVVFDIDGTLAHHNADPGEIYDVERLKVLEPWDNVIAMVRRYIATPSVDLMFCSGRPKSTYRVTWDWLNRYLHLSSSGKAATLVLRPPEVPEDRIAPYKLGEIVQAIRRLGSKPSEALIFDDDIANLQMFEVLRPMVRRLRLYKVEEGIATQWGDV